MQFLKIGDNMSLSELSDIVGSENVDAVLALNGLPRTPNVSKTLKIVTDHAKDVSISYSDDPDAIKQKKISVINQYSENSDVFEAVASLDEGGWNILAHTGTFENTLKVPESVKLPNTDDVMGNTDSVSKFAYNSVIDALQNDSEETPYQFNPYWFSDISSVDPIKSGNSGGATPFNWFNLPIGDVSLYSTLAQESIDFPCYPSEFSDGVKANYDTMPDMLYQYEPWQVYKSSGPRQMSFTFDMHRDMWSGNHEDGKCNELIRFCEANCYARYNGAAVETALVTMYIKGKPLITGIMTDVTPHWDTESPIGNDGFYLHVKLSLTIIEVSQVALSYDVFKAKPLIG